MASVRGSLTVGTTFAGRYELLAYLGGGGDSEVYQVCDAATHKILALKILREDAGGEAQARFRNEYKCLARFAHPHIVAVIDLGSLGGRQYFTADFVGGRPVNKYFAKGYTPALEDVAIQILDALSTIHAQGLVHCDIKPANLLVGDVGGQPFAKLLDFGFTDKAVLSGTIEARGTLGYLAPEVLSGTSIDARADLYSLGVVLYEILTHEGPTEARDLRHWLSAQYHSLLRLPRSVNPNIPERFERLVMSLLCFEPDRRPPTAAAAIRELTAPEPPVPTAGEQPRGPSHTTDATQPKQGEQREYLKAYQRVSELIGMNLQNDDFFERILDSVIDVIKAERGLLFLMQGGKLVPAAARNVDHTTIEDASAISHSVLRKVRRQGETVFSADALADPRFNSADSVMLQKIRSLLCVPLRVENRVIGTIYVDSRVTSHLFLDEDMNLLVSLANLLAATIDNSAAFRKLREEMSALRENALVDAATGYFMGRSKAMKDVYRVIDRIAPSNCSVLLTGETGTGKGVLARLIHAKSERRDTRFVSINCGALPENLFESELFGHARGSFTGAVKDKVGLFEAATGGTVFLDEISNTTLGVQAKLLQVLDEKVIRRVGETEPQLVDVRLICATNRELRQEVEAGRFREDLFYRMNGVTINVPALRERAGDVALLADYFVKRYATQLDKRVEGCEESVLDVFANYAWPGNVRELQNVIERSVIMAQTRRVTLGDLGAQFFGVDGRTESLVAGRKHFDRLAVADALRTSGGNVSKAAELLGMHRRQLQRLIARFGIDRADPSEGAPSTAQSAGATATRTAALRPVLSREVVMKALAAVNNNVSRAARIVGVPRKTFQRACTRHLIYPHPTPETLAANTEEAKRIAAQRKQTERQQVWDALVAASGNVSRAAEFCGYTRQYFYRLVHKHGLELSEYRKPSGATKLSRVSTDDVTFGDPATDDTSEGGVS